MRQIEDKSIPFELEQLSLAILSYDVRGDVIPGYESIRYGDILQPDGAVVAAECTSDAQLQEERSDVVKLDVSDPDCKQKSFPSDLIRHRYTNLSISRR